MRKKLGYWVVAISAFSALALAFGWRKSEVVVVAPKSANKIELEKKDSKIEVSLRSKQIVTRTSLGDFVAQLETLQGCYEAECDFPDHEPRSYSHALGQKIVKTLEELTSWVLVKQLNDESVALVAREHIYSEDKFVQAAALELFATQPTSLENLLAILEGVFAEGYDANLVEPTLKELERYKDPQDLSRINEVLAQALLTGTPYMAEEVSLRLGPFVDSNSLPFYREILQQLPDGSVFKSNLESVLEIASR